MYKWLFTFFKISWNHNSCCSSTESGEGNKLNWKMGSEPQSQEVKNRRDSIRPFSIVLRKDIKVKRKAVEQAKERLKKFSIVLPKMKMSQENISQFRKHSTVISRYWFHFQFCYNFLWFTFNIHLANPSISFGHPRAVVAKVRAI